MSNKPLHMMIDIETLGIRSNSIVLTLGGVKFNPFTDDISDEFYVKFDITEQENLNRHIDESTVKWWDDQDKAVRDEAFSPDGRKTLEDGLFEFNKWIGNSTELWSQGGTGFDIRIMENLYKDAGNPVPWPYWGVRDSRTIISLLPYDPRKKLPESKEAHNALADCKMQAKAIQKAFELLGVNALNNGKI